MHDLAVVAAKQSLRKGLTTSLCPEVETIDIVDAGAGVDIQIRLKDQANRKFEARRRRLAGPVGCGLCGIESIEEAMRSVDEVGKATLTLSTGDITQSVKLLSRRRFIASCHPS